MGQVTTSVIKVERLPVGFLFEKSPVLTGPAASDYCGNNRAIFWEWSTHTVGGALFGR